MTNQGKLNYNPDGSFQVRTHDVEYRRENDTSLLATVYQPQGEGPFPALLDVHGGVWNLGSRADNEFMDLALACSGIVVVAVDFRLAPEHPYPAQVADVNYAIRWLKANARSLNADPYSVGALGSSSGGHTVMLGALRPNDPRYRALPLPGEDNVDAAVLYVIGAWPVLDPHARYQYAREAGNQRLVSLSEAYFLTEDAMREGNPQQVLERREEVHLPPALIIQGTADNNVPLSIPEKFTRVYRAAGGSIQLELFPGQPHGFGNNPGPDSERALGLTKAFVARQLALTSPAV